MNANRHKKKNNGLIHITMKGKVKDANMLKMPLYFWNEKFSFLKARIVHVHKASHLNTVKDVRENKTILQSEL